MKYIVSSEEMKRYDKNTTKVYNVPEIVLVEQAAGAMVNELSNLFSKTNTKLNIEINKKPILVVCGIGNNGADGVAVARLLNEKGYEAVVCIITDKQIENSSESFRLELGIYKSYGYKVNDGSLVESLYSDYQNTFVKPFRHKSYNNHYHLFHNRLHLHNHHSM